MKVDLKKISSFALSCMIMLSVSSQVFADTLDGSIIDKSSTKYRSEKMHKYLTEKDIDDIRISFKRAGINLTDDQLSTMRKTNKVDFTDEQYDMLTKDLQNLLNKYNVTSNRIIESKRDRNGVYHVSRITKNDNGQILLKYTTSTHKDGKIDYSLTGADTYVINYFKRELAPFIVTDFTDFTKSDYLNYQVLQGVFDSLTPYQQKALKEEGDKIARMGEYIKKSDIDFSNKTVDYKKAEAEKEEVEIKKEVDKFNSKVSVESIEKLIKENTTDSLNKASKMIVDALDEYNSLSFGAQSKLTDTKSKLNDLNAESVKAMDKLKERIEDEKVRENEAKIEAEKKAKNKFSITTFLVVCIVLVIAATIGFFVYNSMSSRF